MTEVVEAIGTRTGAYRGVLRSTSLIGGASLITILVGLVRTKFVALIVGPAGVGLIGAYVTIVGVVGTVAGMGLAMSGVRAIAEAHGAGDFDRLTRTVATLRWTVWFAGAAGLAVVLFASQPISRFTFGTPDYANAIAVLGLAVFFTTINTVPLCLLQGTRRIGTLARVNVASAVLGATMSVVCLGLFGKAGISSSLVLTAVAGLGCSWWFSRGIAVPERVMRWTDGRTEAGALLKLGVPLMLSSLTSTLTFYYISTFLVRKFGLDGAGMWQASFALSGGLVNFVLGAMATDYYPRLTAAAHDNVRVSDEVNTQTEVALLLAVPALAATLIFAPVAIPLLYSNEFTGAVQILQWSVFGILGRVISWPLGYVLLAKGRGKTFLLTEVVHYSFYVTAVVYCTKLWGLAGAGIAFFLLYLLVTPVNYTIARAISGTRWSSSTRALGLGLTLGLLTIGVITVLTPIVWVKMLINSSLLVALGAYCLRRLSAKTGLTGATIRKALGWSA